jgi:hypothetical protein
MHCHVALDQHIMCVCVCVTWLVIVVNELLCGIYMCVCVCVCVDTMSHDNAFIILTSHND